MSSSQIIERVEKTTASGKKLVEIKLQSGRWLQIWETYFDGTLNNLYQTAQIGRWVQWTGDLSPVEKKPGYYKWPKDGFIVPPQPQPRPQPQPQPQPRPQPVNFDQIQKDREQKIQLMADRRDALMERHIAALEANTAAIEYLAEILKSWQIRPPSTDYPDYMDYPDLNTGTEADLANAPSETQPDPDKLHDEPGY